MPMYVFSLQRKPSTGVMCFLLMRVSGKVYGRFEGTISLHVKGICDDRGLDIFHKIHDEQVLNCVTSTLMKVKENCPCA
jgi:hypothetical protein